MTKHKTGQLFLYPLSFYSSYLYMIGYPGKVFNMEITLTYKPVTFELYTDIFTEPSLLQEIVWRIQRVLA